MIDTDPFFFWIGDPDPDHPFVTRSFADPDTE